MKIGRRVISEDEYLDKNDVECSGNDWSRKKPRTVSEGVQCPRPPQGTGKYTQFTDCVYNLPLYLAQYSLVSFDYRQVFENVILLDTMRYMSDHQCATYLITFQATFSTDYDHERSDDESTDDESTDFDCSNNQSSHTTNGSNDERIDNVQTFQTKIFVSPLHPPTMIQIEFVRIKSSEFCYYWEHTIENLDEFVPTRHKPGIVTVRTQYFEEEEKEEEKKEEEKEEELEEEEEEEKLSDKDTEENPKIISNVHRFCPPQSANDQERIDYWDRMQKELEEDWKDGSDLRIQLKQYGIDVKNSDGFDVGDYPLLTGGTIIVTGPRRYYDLAADNLYTAPLNRLVYLSQLAICLYNMKEGKDFDNVKVVKAMSFGVARTGLNITFEASSPGGIAITFQTRISTRLCSSYKNIEIDFVRIKPT